MYHFIGIKGTGMGALAQIMQELGYQVQGSDKPDHFFTEIALKEKGITILEFDENNIKDGLIIVQGNAYTDTNIEVKKAKELGLKIYTYQEMIGDLTKKFKTIAISGCHGKTTTTSMTAHIFNNIVGCNYLIGDGTGHANDKNEYFALESCEWKRHFLSYLPYYAVITNIELDHVDYFKDIDDVISAYEEFANKAQESVIACGDDLYTKSLKVNKPIYFYGIDESNDIVAKNVKFSNEGTIFDVYVNKELYGNFNLPIFGKHMLLDALAVISICYFEKLDPTQVANYFKTYKSAKRRFKETIIKDIVIVDDYAHHPTEVEVTIKGARQKYPDKQIIALLRTHTLSRTKAFAKEFASAMSLADISYVMDIGQDREELGYEGVTCDLILDQIKGGKYITFDDEDELLQYENAVLLFMSSKDIYILKEKYEKKLREKLNI